VARAAAGLLAYIIYQGDGSTDLPSEGALALTRPSKTYADGEPLRLSSSGPVGVVLPYIGDFESKPYGGQGVVLASVRGGGAMSACADATHHGPENCFGRATGRRAF
jgi:hypothetical protein